jgi:anti-anti-sigma factor
MATSVSAVRAPSPVPEGAATAPWIDVGFREAPGELVIQIAGEAGVAQAGALAAALLRLSARRAPLVTLDLSRLSFLSSLALGALVSYRRGVVRAGGRVRLAAAVQGPVRESLERAELLTLFGPPEGGEAALPVTLRSSILNPRKAEV